MTLPRLKDLPLTHAIMTTDSSGQLVGCNAMSKKDLVETIRKLNPTAPEDFLARFSEADLIAYLHQLQEAARPSPGWRQDVFSAG